MSCLTIILPQELLNEYGLRRDSTWPSVSRDLHTDGRFTALPQGLDLGRIYRDTVVAQAPIYDFQDLLQECEYPRLGPGTPWGQARRQVCIK